MSPRKLKNIDTIKLLGVNNQCTTKDRITNDHYGSPPESIDWLLKYEEFNNKIWEPMCGGGGISERLKQHGYDVYSSDIVDYGYESTEIKDFKKCTETFDGDIISNPPYKDSIEMTLKSLELSNRKVAFLMKIQFLETVKRYNMIFEKHPPKKILAFVKRISCSKNGEYLPSSAVFYCWVIWDKEYEGKTVFEWIPNHKREIKAIDLYCGSAKSKQTKLI